MAEKDNILVEKVLAGDRDLFGDLVERYTGLVHGILLEKIRRPDEVEDLVQDSFAQAYEQLAALREPAKFGPWIGRIAANMAADWLRLRQKRTQAEQSGQTLYLNRHIQQPAEHFEERERDAILWEALDRLPPEQRRVVVLYHLEGCPQRRIARFLGISRATVRWRLYRAWNQLGQELQQMWGQEAAYRLRAKRSARDKVMAVLPAVPFFRLQPPVGLFQIWARRAMLLLGGASLVGLSGFLLFQEVERLREGETTQRRAGGFHVRREQVDLPAQAVLWHPSRPQVGQSVRLELVGPDLPDEGPAYLHYIADLDEPRDQVVEMQREGEGWTALVEIPSAASNLFFYAAATADPQRFEPGMDGKTWMKRLKRYSGALTVYDARGRPVRNAAFGLGKWASYLEHPAAEIMAHYKRELVRHPDHVEANQYRWNLLQWGDDLREEDLAANHARIQAEKETLRRRYPDNPELAWILLDNWDLEALRAFAHHFPEHENAAAAAYRATFRPFYDHAKRVVALEQFLSDFPRSPYVDDAYRDLLYMFDRIDRVRGKELADALISRRLVPYFDLEMDRSHDQPRWTSAYEGALPEARAYTLRYKWYAEQGDRAGAVELARRLLHSSLADPIPYVLVGRQLAQADSTRILGLEVLEAGRPWTDPDHMLTLPLFVVSSKGSTRMQEGMQRYRRDDAIAWRIACLQALGRAYLEGGDCVRAARFLRQTVALQDEYATAHPPLDERVYLELGRASSCADDWDGAVDAYLQVYQHYYHHPEAEAGLERLYRERYGDLERLRPQLAAAWSAAPEFSAVDMAGDSLHLAAERGQPLLLFCDWRQVTSRPELDLKQLASWHDHFARRGAKILFLTKRTTYYPNNGRPAYRHEDVILAKVRERGYPFRVFFVEEETRKQYATTMGGLVLFLVDRSGRLRLRQDRSREFDRALYDRVLSAKLEDLLEERGEVELTARISGSGEFE